ncbi:hypothetical protein ACFQ0D_33295, partial [Micromonospora zhanjiangensis]
MAERSSPDERDASARSGAPGPVVTPATGRPRAEVTGDDENGSAAIYLVIEPSAEREPASADLPRPVGEPVGQLAGARLQRRDAADQ